MGSNINNQTTYIVIGLAAIATAAALWYVTSKSGGDDSKATKKKGTLPTKDADGGGSVDSGITPTKSNVRTSNASSSMFYSVSQQTMQS